MPTNLQPHVNWYANAVFTIFTFDFRKANWFDWLKKTKVVKAVKASKLSQSEASETFCEFKCRRNVLFTSINQFLKVKSAFKPGRIAAHENLDVINMTIRKQKGSKTEPESKFI